jgi:biotin synthase-like enzyme
MPGAAPVESLDQLRALALCRLIFPAAPRIGADIQGFGEQHALTALTCGADTLIGSREAIAATTARFGELDLRLAMRA